MKTIWCRTVLAFASFLSTLLPGHAITLSVGIDSPTNGATFTRPINVLISASAGSVAVASAYTNVARVNFYAQSSTSTTQTLIGSQTTSIPELSGEYTVLWTNPAAGSYLLSAVAINFQEQRATSAPVAVTIKSTDSVLPLISVVATDPYATKSPTNTGTFTVFRTGSTSNSLTVYYGLSGTASNGIDYSSLPGTVTFNVGESSEDIVVQPLDSAIVTAPQTATLELHQPPLGAPTTYTIGIPRTATVNILKRPVPPPPTPHPSVHIYTPTNNALFVEPADIFIGAEATVTNGYVATVAFWEIENSRENLIGIKTNNPASVGVINPFYITWTNVPAGAYGLFAVATDDQGNTAISPTIHITVTNAPPPPTNYPPTVRISSPANNSVYHAPVNIPIYVYAFDPDGSVANVEVFAGTNDLGAAQRPCHTATNGTVECPTNYFVITWSNAPLGTYAMTAVATDNVGASKTSEPVNVSILPVLPPPPTNRLPVVNVTATDPIAIEGTNCWTWVAPTNTTTWSNWTASAALPVRLFTNCGPKTATFVVRRDGATNNDLTVGYELGGTATNGVQYVTLPGSVTIPAGERSAIVNVVPLEDGPPEVNMTAILKIKVSTNYFIGTPQRAAVYILDEPQFRRASEITADRCFHLKADGPDGAWFRVDYTTDLTTWTSICTNQVVNGSIDFVDPDAQGDQVRYYRAVPQDTAPPQ
jgi:hypothetical protein